MPSNYAEQMLTALSKGQIETAQQYFTKSLREDSDELIYSLAEDLYALGFLNQSRRAYKTLLKKYPDEDELRTALADIAIEDGEIDEAQNYLAQIMPESDSYIQSLLVKADIYQTEGLNESAEYSLQQAESLAPDEPVIEFALAEFYNANGNFEKAITRYRNLLLKGEREMSKVDIVARLGVAYAQIGRYEHAIGYLEQIKYEQLTLDTKFQLAIIYQETNRDDEAIKLLNEILDVDPKYTSIYPILGHLYEKLGQSNEALRVYQTGISLDETNTKLYQLAGKMAVENKDLVVAENYYRNAIAINEDDTESLFMLADLMFKQQRESEIIELLKDSMSNEVEDERFYWYLALSYQKLGELALAKNYWEEALPLLEDNQAFLQDIIDWYHEIGEVAKEISTTEKYLYLNPDDVDMQMRLENLYED
ncbi:tetratricopeptide repeat protein [Leuconostoc palmae]|uniref:tetratricopeptide repeat protein n=1 Tax=Leuconostoc palmae TaxID=501487 RepID=UPI001C7D9C49|nr:tetratricopeptide repeat protein [Leuconostoc palmae]